MLTKLPYTEAKLVIERIRRRFYTVKWPENRPHIKVDNSVEAVENVLRNEYHAEYSKFSYHYEDEILNLRIPWGVEEVPMELHIRGRVKNGLIELNAHIEPSRFESPLLHVESDNLDWERGYEELRKMLE